ncbi:hypothetical protein VAZ01S_012_00180 [Vibrio azureus NBRC 104587]|uniref:Uncharacterized protein n=1 Tax=Vibrio azureus NBRC 104587 TaxID=1219077 RepID=U3BZ20_9VIBR|nr:hypothetical protein VAZ01S_012_00180 [Vibrio azureus NBRC 104587]
MIAAFSFMAIIIANANANAITSYPTLPFSIIYLILINHFWCLSHLFPHLTAYSLLLIYLLTIDYIKDYDDDNRPSRANFYSIKTVRDDQYSDGETA